MVLVMDGDDDDRIMDDDAQAHIGSRSHLQSGSAVSMRTAHNVGDLNISRVEVDDCPRVRGKPTHHRR